MNSTPEPYKHSSALVHALFAMLVLAVPAAAQVCDPAKVRVTVESENQPVPGAMVRLTSSATVTATTSEDGSAEFKNVGCGTYSIQVSKDGFQLAAQAEIKVLGPESTDIRVTLQPVQSESVDVHATAEPAQQGIADRLSGRDARDLPSQPATVTDALPLIPGVVRSPDGGLVMAGAGEHRSAFIVNRADVTDPATGGFSKSVPVDSVESVNVLKTPFTAEYGRFTSDVVSVETRRGTNQWHYEINDLLPDFRFRSWHMRGVRDESPRGGFNGPILADRLFFSTNVQYDLQKQPSRTLPFPFNESKQESTNSFVQLDAIISSKQILNGTFHMPLQHTSFVNLDFFNPQPVSPNYNQHNYEGTVTDTLQTGAGTLASAISIQRFDASVWSQGLADMILTPTGNRGNYFSGQNREAGRYEWTETLSLVPRTALGTHDIKFGTSIARTSNTGEFSARPVQILDPSGNLLEQISFTGGNPYQVNDLELGVYAQDHWNLNGKLAFDFGVRLERQQIADSLRLAPRAGVAWMPFSGQHTVFYAGYGLFYDRVPLNVYAFSSWPQQVLTFYGPDGVITTGPTPYPNIIGTGLSAPTGLFHASSEPGSFTPRSATFSVQADHTFSPLLRLRINYTENRSEGLVVIQPETAPGAGALVMNGSGRSQYRQIEVTTRFSWSHGQQLMLAYTLSRSQGDLNEFSNFLGNFPFPLIRPNSFTNLPGDLPNRFLAWGRIHLPLKMQILPVLEYRNGFPYSRVDVLENYVGQPNSDRTRYPNFFSADARVSRDFKINAKYSVRLSVSGLNLTNHFNALDVHANIADPQNGIFFGNYKRRYLADFDIIF
jgi:hypothetical protein